jgi:serine-type D-Ala-D-Ala carboxypeptidase/endopeptidase (penicillin-binding protein 4)
MRRLLLPAVLALVALGSGAAAVLPETSPPPRPAPPLPARPVLTPRRVPALLARVVGDARLRRSLDAVLDDPGLGPARERTCLVVEEAGHALYARRPAEPLVPASNLKLLTAAAVLKRLGPDLRLRTEVRAGPGTSPGDGVVDGPLWLVGGGDPLLATGDYTASFRHQPQLRTPLESLADQVRAAGVRDVRGGVLGDEGRYDRQRYVPTWKPDYVDDADVGPASALTVNDNFVRWQPHHDPAPAPATNAAAVLTGLLQQRGIVVGAPPGEGTAPAGTVMASVESPPMAEVVGEMLRESDNLTAELLVKELGRRHGRGGTTAAGVEVVRSTLAGEGFDLAGLVTYDGSGLDRGDRATCALLIGLLRREGDDSWVSRGLPVAGRDGTLAERFVGTPADGRLRAKTGSLDNVAGLSGWVDGGQDHTLAFALLANGLPRSASFGRAFTDRVGLVLASYPDAPPVEELGP